MVLSFDRRKRKETDAPWRWVLFFCAVRVSLASDRRIRQQACGIHETRGRRTVQQDRLVCLGLKLGGKESNCGDAMLVAAFDGHGGSRASDFARTWLSEAVRVELERNWQDPWDPCHPLSHVAKDWMELLIHRKMEEMDDLFFQLAGDTAGEEGTTVLLALLFEKDVLVANLGDTSGMMCSHSGRDIVASLKTKDHNCRNVVERKRIEARGGECRSRPGQKLMRLEGELAITRAIGDYSYRHVGVIPTPEVVWWNVSREHLFFLATTDGVLETMDSSELCIYAWKFLTDSTLPTLTPEPPPAIALQPAAMETCLSNQASAVGAIVHNETMERVGPPWSTQDDDGTSRGTVKKLNWIAESILRESYNRGSSDNLAIVLVLLRPSATLHGMRRMARPRANQGTFLPSSPDDRVEVVETRGYFLEELVGVRGFAFLHQHLTHSNQVSVFHPNQNLEISREISLLGQCREDDFPRIASVVAGAPLHLAVGLRSRPSIMASSSDASGMERVMYHVINGIGRGSFGEAWRARRAGHANRAYVLKRLFTERSEDVKLSGEREIYFGTKLRSESAIEDDHKEIPGTQHLVRFVESFEGMGPFGKELWLVFEDEGTSLHSYMYEAVTEETGDNQESDDKQRLAAVQPSRWWSSMRQSKQGISTLIEIFRQVVLAISACHSRGISHRDVKMENLMVQFSESGRPHVRLIDFGSAVDDHTMEHMYQDGPSRTEQTDHYEPPESLFTEGLGKQRIDRYFKYDAWSLGIIALEMFALGTPDVFALDPRTRAYIFARMGSRDPRSLQLAYLLRSMMELCIYPPSPTVGDEHEPYHGEAKGRHSFRSKPVPAPWECSEDHLMQLLRSRDPLGQGLPSVWALRLVRRLLHWNPASRPSAHEILQHAFFRWDGNGYPCSCGTDGEFPWHATSCESACSREGLST